MLVAVVDASSRALSRDLCHGSSKLRTAAACLARHYAASSSATDVPVAIVGAGPTGLVLSCLLSAFGVRHVVLERAAALTQHPQAHFINHRTMEVLRHIGGLNAQVSSASPPLGQWRRFVYCESMTGEVLGEVDHFPGQTQPLREDLSPEPVTHLSQNRLLPLLLARAQSGGGGGGGGGAAAEAAGQVLWGRAVTSVEVTAAGGGGSGGGSSGSSGGGSGGDVIVTAEARGGGEEQYRCRYLVAADGANSGIRRMFGIPMEGEGAMQRLMNVHFRSPALARRLAASCREAMLYFVFNPEIVSVIVAHDLRAGEFVAQIPFFPPLQSPADFPPHECARLLAAAAGPGLSGAAPQGPGWLTSDPGFEIAEVRPWTMSAQVAASYSAAGGRVLLAGDAAHRFPPAGGFGMNTGIQDAHNLAWKLAGVITGALPEGLLASYEAERRPVALANTALSVRNWREAVRVPAALGLHPAAANLLSEAAAAVPLPPFLGKQLLQTGLAAGRGLAAAVTPLRRGALKRIFNSGQSLGLQFPNEDLGFRYAPGATSAVLDEERGGGGGSGGGGAERLAGGGSGERAAGGGRAAAFEPSSAPGHRLPHCWLRRLDTGERVSSLDLVRPGGLHLMLFTSANGESDSGSGSGSSIGSGSGGQGGGGSDGGGGSQRRAAGGSGNSWAEAAARLREQGWPIETVEITPAGAPSGGGSSGGSDASSGDRGGVSGGGGGSSSSSSSSRAGGGAGHVAAVDSDGAWARLHGGAGSVAVLVRPDGHVAWRALGAAAGVPINQYVGDGDAPSATEGCVRRLEGALRALGWQRAGG